MVFPVMAVISAGASIAKGFAARSAAKSANAASNSSLLKLYDSYDQHTKETSSVERNAILQANRTRLQELRIQDAANREELYSLNQRAKSAFETLSQSDYDSVAQSNDIVKGAAKKQAQTILDYGKLQAGFNKYASDRDAFFTRRDAQFARANKELSRAQITRNAGLQAQQHMYRAQVADINAGLALQQRKHTLAQGHKEAGKIGKSYAGEISNQLAAAAARGVDVAEGSAASIAEGLAKESREQQIEVMSSAEITAYDLDIEAKMSQHEAEVEQINAKNARLTGDFEARISDINYDFEAASLDYRAQTIEDFSQSQYGLDMLDTRNQASSILDEAQQVIDSRWVSYTGRTEARRVELGNTITERNAAVERALAQMRGDVSLQAGLEQVRADASAQTRQWDAYLSKMQAWAGVAQGNASRSAAAKTSMFGGLIDGATSIAGGFL